MTGPASDSVPEQRPEPDDCLLRTLWAAAEDPIITTDLQGRITHWNPAAARVFGYAPAEVIGESILVVVPLRDQAFARAAMDRLRAGEPVPSFRASRLRKDGSPVEVLVSISRVDRDGRPIAFLGIHHDLTEHLRAEEALRHSEARFRALIEHASDLISILGPDGTMIYKSPATRPTLGYAPEELVGRKTFDFLHREDVEPTRAVVEQCIARPGLPVPYAARFRHRDGHWVHLEGTATGLLDDPAVQGIVVTSRDVSERVRAEADLRASEARYRQLFEGNLAVQTLVDPESGRVVDANPAAAEFYGYSREKLRTLHLWDLNALPREVIRERLRRIGERTLRVVHSPHRIASGDIRAVEVRSTPLELDGRVLLHSIIHDITERIEAEMQVRASETRLRMLLRQVPALIWTTDRELTLVSLEGSALAALGIERERVERQPIEALYPSPEAAAPVVEEHRAALAGRASTLEVVYGGRLFSAHLEPLRDGEGHITGVVGVAFDVTDRRVLEEQLQQARKMEAIGRLAGGIAHDFNNLLTAIRGNADFLLQDLPEESPSHADVREIVHAAERAADLTQQLLAFSRKQVLRPRRLDLNRTVRETERMLRRVIGEHIALVVELDPSVGVVEADPGQIAQVLMNLAINARDAMPGGGEIVLTTHRAQIDERSARVAPFLPAGTPAVRLCVRDTGSGMPPEVLEHVFEPFFTTKPHGQGTGLGLATVYGIVKQSGGYIWVDSEPGRGSRFTIYLPVVDGAQPDDAEVAEAEPAPAEGTVLLVEDDAAVRAIARRMLERAGYTVLVAAGGDEALRVAASHGGVDLLITDVVMPGMNGRDLAERLQRTNERLRVLFMSGYTDDAVLHHGVGEGDAAFIQKPFSPGELVRRAAALLAE